MTHYEGKMQKLGRTLDKVLNREIDFLILRLANFSASFPTRINITRDVSKIGHETPVSGDEIARITRR